MSAQILDFGEKVYLKIAQHSQEHTCARVYLLKKVQAWSL